VSSKRFEPATILVPIFPPVFTRDLAIDTAAWHGLDQIQCLEVAVDPNLKHIVKRKDENWDTLSTIIDKAYVTRLTTYV
jgi:hypothetical protein